MLSRLKVETNHVLSFVCSRSFSTGQSGLDTAARLKAHGVDALAIDRTERIGDGWRKRYASLRLVSVD